MSMKSIVGCSAILSCVSLASVRVSTQEILPQFTMGWQEGVATVVEKNGVTTALNFRMPVEAKVVKGAPFSADIVTESIQTLADGNRIVQRSITHMYRDSEGRVRREEDRGAQSPVISITDPVSGMSYSLDPENRIARRMPTLAGFRITAALQEVHEQLATRVAPALEKLKVLAASGQLANQHNTDVEIVGPGSIETARAEQVKIETARAEQVKVERLAAHDIEGVRAEGTRRTTIIAAGTIGNELPIEIVSEERTSPDLKILVMTERRDPRLGTSTYRLVDIVRSEPDRYLFQVPSDYTVREPDITRKRVPAPGKQ
jgi:hypothetical protein